MNPRVGMKAILVRLLASESKNEVADETGVSYASNSSVRHTSRRDFEQTSRNVYSPTEILRYSMGSVSHCSCLAALKHSCGKT